LQDLSLKAFECPFQTLAFLNPNFCQRISLDLRSAFTVTIFLRGFRSRADCV
jgi:hypothetical protein